MFARLALTAWFFVSSAYAWNSAVVRVDTQGRLTYVADANGNRIPDYSHAGYRGGGVPLPTSIPIVKTLSVATGDQTARIQAALDEVAALPVQTNGYRGALQLSAGTWDVLGTLHLNVNGVVLSGAGNGDDAATNTILRRTGTSQNAIVQAGNRDDQFESEVSGTRSQITTARVQVGSLNFQVDHPEYYKIGDPVIIWQPSTQTWLDAVDRGGVTDNNYWRPGEIEIRYHRYVTAITNSTITVDAPVFTHLDRSLSQSYLFKYNNSHVLTRLGIEKLQVNVVTAGETSEDHAEDAIKFIGTEDSWIRDCTMKHFWHAGVQWEGSTRCTAERCRAIEPNSIVTGGRRYNFSMYHAQLILVRDSFASYSRHAYVCNGTSLDSGVVFLDSVIDHALTSAEGHRRWSTGLLYDNIVATNRDQTDILGLYNRGTYGTGHGWAAAHSVAWNCNASSGGRIWIQRPPTAQNYGIGCTGNVTGIGPFAGPVGYIEGTNQTGLNPRSLYLAQLAQRLAESAPPTITGGPSIQTASAGDMVTLTVAATGGTAYQWKFNGASIPGATEPSYIIRGAAAVAHAGDYTVTVTNPAGATTSPATTLVVVPASDAGRLLNLSVRALAGSGAQTLIVGTVLGGDGTVGTRPVLLRGIGPSLATFGITNYLSDPSITLLSDGIALASNTDWKNNAQIASVGSQVGAFPLASSLDAALYQPTLARAGYSMQVTGAASIGGVAMAELYDATAAENVASGAPRLINVSARSQVGTGGDVLIAGFVLGGSTSKTMLLRAVGSSLAPFGVTGTLADPMIELYRDGKLVASNDDWGSDAVNLGAAFTATGAFPLPDGSHDAAMLLSLPPGNYSAQVSGVGNTTGVALVEVYEAK
jgi:hypothetical protein